MRALQQRQAEEEGKREGHMRIPALPPSLAAGTLRRRRR